MRRIIGVVLCAFSVAVVVSPFAVAAQESNGKKPTATEKEEATQIFNIRQEELRAVQPGKFVEVLGSAWEEYMTLGYPQYITFSQEAKHIGTEGCETVQCEKLSKEKIVEECEAELKKDGRAASCTVFADGLDIVWEGPDGMWAK